MRVGAFTIRDLESTRVIDGETVSGVSATGRARLFEVVSDGIRLTLRDVVWGTGERDLVAVERHDSPQRFDTLVERLRLSIADVGPRRYAELKQVRLKPNGRGNLFVPDRAALQDAAGVDVVEVLENEGALVGTRAELLNDDGRAREHGVLFDGDARFVPVIVYVCTRIAPVASDTRA